VDHGRAGPARCSRAVGGPGRPADRGPVGTDPGDRRPRRRAVGGSGLDHGMAGQPAPPGARRGGPRAAAVRPGAARRVARGARRAGRRHHRPGRRGGDRGHRPGCGRCPATPASSSAPTPRRR
jgi:hypothetical protein